jgi:CRP-like cAMP-binding protein
MPVEPTLIKSIPLFAQLADPDINLIAQEGQLRQFEAGRTIASHSAQLSYLHILVGGLIQASIINAEGQVISLQLLGYGESIGWLSVIDGQPLSKNYTSAQNSTILQIPISIARNLLLTKPLIAQQILKMLAETVRKSDRERIIQNLPNAFQRVYAHIAHLAQSKQSLPEQSALPKQHEIAVIANTSRETVSRALQILINQGIVIKQGHKIFIHELQKLQKISEQDPTDPKIKGE